MNKTFEKLGFYPADILLPKDQDMTKWAVVACDQFTSEPEYWQAVEEKVGKAPSTLRLILPEANLKAPNVDEYISGINAAMEQYLKDGVFRTLEDSLIYVERQQSDGTHPPWPDRHGGSGRLRLHPRLRRPDPCHRGDSAGSHPAPCPGAPSTLPSSCPM